MITRIGEIALSDVVPLLAEFQAALSLAQGIAIGELSAKLDGLANVLAAITVAPPSLGAQIQGAIETVAALQLSINGPSIGVDVSMILALQADLQAQLALLTGSIQLPNASVSVFVYSGPSASMGTEVGAEITSGLPGAGPGDHTNALIIATTSNVAWQAVEAMFRTS